MATLVEFLRGTSAIRGVGDPLQLVLAGLPGVGIDELMRQIERSTAHEAIHVTGYVSEEERSPLSGAKAMVHPAWYEGFGVTHA